MRKAFSLALILLLAGTTASFARGTPKPYQPARAFHAGEAGCPDGVTHLCIPLDGSFQVVRFDGTDSGNGPADPLDPCQRNDDGTSSVIALPFTFSLYGTSYNEVFINNNGNVSFGQGYAEYTSTGFPIAGFPMVAPFWADVDTRDLTAGGVVHYRIDAHKLVVIWDHVGYYSAQSDKLNTFELLISDGTDPDLGVGNNVCFCYDDMQWTTGGASGGSGGFGGSPATVGVNRGDGANFFQLGLFDHAGSDYDGPGGSADGVDYLDGRNFCFNVSASDNIPPVPQGFPQSLADTICVDQFLTINTAFASPELGQTTTTVVDLHGLANASVVSNPGNPSTQTVTFQPDYGEVGSHVITYTATDDGTPSKTTTVNLTIVVENCITTTRKSSWGHVKSLYR